MKNFNYSITAYNTRDKLRSVISSIQDIIGSTLGPKGSTVILSEQGELPHITKDGVSVAEFLTFDDPFDETINKIIKETARKTAEKVGDGTTTSIILTTELIEQILTKVADLTAGKERIKAVHSVLIEVRKEFQKVIDKLKEYKIDLSTFEDEKTLSILEAIIRTSSNNDERVVKLVMDILTEIGPNGLIDVRISNNEITTSSVQDGMLIESLAHVNKAEQLNKPYIALVSSKLEKVHQIKTLLMRANQLLLSENTPVIVVAKEFSEEIQNVVTVNNRLGKTAVFLVEADGFANNMLEILDDMATILECKVLSTDQTSPFGLQNVDYEHLGTAESAIVTPQYTVVYPGHKLSEHALDIKAELEDFLAAIKKSGEERIGEIRQMEKRLTKFSKSAKIYVGGTTEAAKVELKDRIDDAVQAVQSAVNHGVVPGGGVALFMAGIKATADAASPIYKVCRKPIDLLNQSVGFAFNVDKIVLEDGKMINFATEKIMDWGVEEVVDPADVLIMALQQAVDTAEILLKGSSILIKHYSDGEN
jgi:chaperonin GroEL